MTAPAHLITLITTRMQSASAIRVCNPCFVQSAYMQPHLSAPTPTPSRCFCNCRGQVRIYAHVYAHVHVVVVCCSLLLALQSACTGLSVSLALLCSGSGLAWPVAPSAMAKLHPSPFVPPRAEPSVSDRALSVASAPLPVISASGN